MNNKLAKMFSSFTMAAMISFTSVTAQATEAAVAGCICGTDFCDTDNWGH